MIDIIQLFDLLGFYSFFVVSGIIFLTFYRRVALLFAYFIGFLVNYYINSWLKTWIQDPRPENPIPMVIVDDSSMYVGAEKYGFPSGHAQLVFYAITFLYFANKKITRTWIVCLFIGLITIYQRLKYRRHTVEQLLAGTLIGIITGWITMTNFSGDSVAKRLEPQSGSVRFLHSFPRIGFADSEKTDVTFEVSSEEAGSPLPIYTILERTGYTIAGQ